MRPLLRVSLLRAAGEITIAESVNMANMGKSDIQKREKARRITCLQAASGTPLILQHGDLKSIAPRYKDLTAHQRAVDMIFMGIKILYNCAKTIFSTQTRIKPSKTYLCALFAKWFAVLEDQIPARDSFIHGLSYPVR